MTPPDEREGLPSASGMDRLNHCPGSRAAEEGLADLPHDVTTEDGSAIHSAIEDDEDEDLNLTQKEIADRLKAMEARAIDAWRMEFNLEKVSEPFRETRLWIRDPVNLELLCSAKLDVFSLAPTSAMVLDFKSGFLKPTASEKSWQLRTQSVSLWQEHRELTHIRCGFAHSRLSSTLDCTDYGVEDLKAAEREIRHVVWRAQQPDATRVPGAHCRWCKARGICPESATFAMIPQAVMPAKADGLEIAKAIGLMSPKQLGHVFARKSTIESILEGVKARLLQLHPTQLAEAGYGVVPGNKNKVIVDAPTAFNRLASVLTNEERWMCVDIVRGRVTDSVAKRLGISKKEAGERVLQAMGDAVVEKPGNPKLKPL